MSQSRFCLRPFPTDDVPAIEITGEISRHNNRLAIRYELLGDLAAIAVPTPSTDPVRQDNLWQDTCLEFFFGIAHAPAYWEVNLSPAGDWNLYRFRGYRQGMQEEMALTTLPFVVKHQPDALKLNLELNLDSMVTTQQVLDVGITAVIKLRNGEISYWALTHPGAEADFHRRDSFILELN